MTFNGWFQILLYCVVILILTRPMGGWLHRVYAGRQGPFVVLRPVERGIYRLAGIDPEREQGVASYTAAMLVFSGAGFLFLFALQRLQGMLPLNPMGMGGTTPDLAFNTAVSFVSNTNWQSYAGEATMGYLTQMAGLAVQNFASAATGMAIAVALVRAFARQGQRTIGNFWVDLVRSTLYVLLPISVVIALFFVWQGVPQTFGPSVEATTLEGGKQVLAIGPVASQEAIKMLGTNGGGFFNANSAHPFENPSALTNFVQMVAIFVIGAGFTNLFGRELGDERKGWAILAAMGVIFIGLTGFLYWAESAGNPIFAQLGVSQPLGNMEGKEVRFGVAVSSLFAAITTSASCGAVIAMHDSLTALGGLVPLVNMMLSEVVVGGVGAGLYGMLLYVLLGVFIAGLMVGRTPEYGGKKITAREIRFAILAILSPSFAILIPAAVAIVLPQGLAGLANAGPHGLSEILYAFTSAAANNGSAFAGLSANTPFFNTMLGVSMLLGRFAMIVPIMAIAGALVGKRSVPPSQGTFPTHTPLFVTLLVATIVIVGGLTFLPVLALGPIAEHFAMLAGQLY